MPSKHPPTPRVPAGSQAPCAASPADATLQPQKEDCQHDKSGNQDLASPRAGRTSGLGRRAERPSEGTDRQGAVKRVAEPGRSSKAPSAKEPGRRAGGRG